MLASKCLYETGCIVVLAFVSGRHSHKTNYTAHYITWTSKAGNTFAKKSQIVCENRTRKSHGS